MKLTMTLLAMAGLLMAGCGKPETEVAGNGNQNQPNPKSGSTGEQKEDHSGWWCVEHGIPEDECSMCNAKVAADFKKKGDWCKKHNRAQSQCFKCDPSKAEGYVRLYEQKFGKKPPKPTE